MYKKGETTIWEQEVIIPTYETGEPDPNPMFLEKRVYQGSSGKVYPYPVIDKITDRRIDKSYKVIFLENDFLQIMVMPELGGRIQRAFDKTNQYDFVYYNHVIKPALVGLTGPWISGGIEFNWPQHHRPNTYGPVDYMIEENEDGSKTVWLSEVDRMYGTKGMEGITLYPDKAYIEIKGQLYNRTEENQTFLWWANPAIPVNDQTQSVFPPDVNAVMDHGKRAVSKFPIATGEYYKMDYSEGVDISRYKNIPVPTSYMAYKSDYNFVGSYDYGVNAGILHVANHHISPGKKQWTWGNGDFGQAWDRNLTDADGPYIELMTGVYTDNQPDFTWLSPYEEKTFVQYFMPYKNIGMVKNATTDVAIALEVKDSQADIGVYVTGIHEDLRVVLRNTNHIYVDEKVNLSPEKTFEVKVSLAENEKEHELKLLVEDQAGKVLVSYSPKKATIEEIPEPAQAIDEPHKLKNTEALYLAGKHIEQYRHATYEPEDYYLEGLKRDPEDIRINNAYGALLLRRGCFETSEVYFRQAIQTAIRHSPNPYDGEGYYYLGLCLKYQGRYEEAYSAFYKATWNASYQHVGYYHIAQLDVMRGDYNEALIHIEKSVVSNYHSMNARNLKTVILRKLHKIEEARKFTKESLAIDRLDFMAKNELNLIAGQKENISKLIGRNIHTYLIVAQEYGDAGIFEEAVDVIKGYVEQAAEIYPMAYYYLGYYTYQMGDVEGAKRYYKLGELADPKYCFPNHTKDILVLKHVIQNLESAGMAAYYLGNLLYDKKQYNQAIDMWEKCIVDNPDFCVAYRNLSLAYFNKQHKPDQAKEMLEKAFELNPKDARIFLELDQLYRKMNVSPVIRKEMFEKHKALVVQRDDLYVEYITLLNMAGEYHLANELIKARKFHPWEGGEGKITKQYVETKVALAKEKMEMKAYEEAIAILEEALVYPHNLGEGKLAGETDNRIYYYMGECYGAIGDVIKMQEVLQKAVLGIDEPASAMYYNDQPPEVIFYQGLAYEKLGETVKAKSKFNKLVDYGEKHIYDQVKIDYFAVSLPDFLIFDEDLDKRNQIHCIYLMALGHTGLKNNEKAKIYFEQVLALDQNHQGAISMMSDYNK